jgi:hypothetical protein
MDENMSEEIKLKPCIFCNSIHVKVDHDGCHCSCIVLCQDCGLKASWDDNEENTIHYWNRREEEKEVVAHNHYAPYDVG